MSFRDEVESSLKKGGNPSLYEKILSDMAEDDAKELAEMVADRGVSGNAIARALRARGFKVSDSAIYKWRERL